MLLFQILSEKEREMNREMLMMMENGGSRYVSPVGYHWALPLPRTFLL